MNRYRPLIILLLLCLGIAYAQNTQPTSSQPVEAPTPAPKSPIRIKTFIWKAGSIESMQQKLMPKVQEWFDRNRSIRLISTHENMGVGSDGQLHFIINIYYNEG